MCAYEVGGGAGGSDVNVDVNVNTSGKVFMYAYDPSGQIWNPVWVDNSGTNRILVATSGQEIIAKISGETVVANVVTDISGQTVRLWRGSGHNAVYLTNQSGTLPAIIDASGRLAVTNSGSVMARTSA